MKKIYKYTLKLDVIQAVLIPGFVRILSVHNQKDAVNVWIETDTALPEKTVNFHIYGTGNVVNSNVELDFIGTVHLYDGELVFHVFSEKG